MDQQEKNAQIQQEMEELMPKGLSEEEVGIWRMCFNALRIADFASIHPSEGSVIAMFATVQTIFAGHCTSLSGPVLDAEKKRIVLTCSNPNTDIYALLQSKGDLFPTWNFLVDSHKGQEPSSSYDKVDFVKNND